MKKLLVLVLTFFLGINVTNAVNTIPRTDEDLGVNKKWDITESNIDNVKRTPRVDASEKIYDFAEIISEEEETELKGKIDSYISKTNMDMVILTTDLELNDYELEDYAADFYDYNDFGINYEGYSGIILIINMNSFNRFFNVFTFGDAQLYYDYDRCEIILDYIFDDIKEGLYYNGFTKYIEKSETIFERGKVEGLEIDDNGYVHVVYVYHIPWIVAFFIAGIATLVIMLILIKKNKMVKKETQASVYTDKGSIVYKNKVDKFLRSHTSTYVISSSSSSGGSHSSSSHSGSSGGGHGGGGGRHF